MPAIDLAKGEKKLNAGPIQEDKTQKMQEAVKLFIEHLQIRHDQFDRVKAFEELYEYIIRYDRILYSPISNIIYSFYEDDMDNDIMGTLMSNLDELVMYANNPQIIADIKIALPQDQNKKVVDDTRKAVFKIWDHVNLANQQYKVLKQTDAEYTEKFKKRISTYKEEMTKDMNAQLLTLVSIFTALAFLVFGGISSLDNAFSVSGVPLLKLICSGLIWGLCILNLIFVFLFCVGKMTKMNFKSKDEPDATIFQKYPIVWWSDLLLASLLIICMWMYFMQRKEINLWFVNVCVKYPVCATIVGFIVILSVIAISVWRLALATDVVKKRAK